MTPVSLTSQLLKRFNNTGSLEIPGNFSTTSSLSKILDKPDVSCRVEGHADVKGIRQRRELVRSLSESNTTKTNIISAKLGYGMTHIAVLDTLDELLY